MFARKNQDAKPVTVLEKESTALITDMFNRTYQEECKKRNAKFYARVEIYLDEIVYILSLTHNADDAVIPTTLFFSREFGAGSELNKILDNLNESAGIFFDHFFSASDENEHEFYQIDWSEQDFGKETLFYRVSRENIELTLEAEKLLR